jgi:MbtH protein
MSNPFENENIPFLVLVNAENQHSLWPEFMVIPEGWDVVCGPASRKECIEYTEENWKDIKPKSLQNL